MLDNYSLNPDELNIVRFLQMKGESVSISAMARFSGVDKKEMQRVVQRLIDDKILNLDGDTLYLV